jgi:hypothetical protein
MNGKLVGSKSTHIHPLQCINLYNGSERFSSISAAFFNINFSQEKKKLKTEVDERKGNKKRYKTIRNVYGTLNVISDPYELHVHLRSKPSLHI